MPSAVAAIIAAAALAVSAASDTCAYPLDGESAPSCDYAFTRATRVEVASAMLRSGSDELCITDRSIILMQGDAQVVSRWLFALYKLSNVRLSAGAGSFGKSKLSFMIGDQNVSFTISRHNTQCGASLFKVLAAISEGQASAERSVALAEKAFAAGISAVSGKASCAATAAEQEASPSQLFHEVANASMHWIVDRHREFIFKSYSKVFETYSPN